MSTVVNPLHFGCCCSDEQCTYQRSGLLCGSCKSNLSLAIGTSQCLECTNTHFTLLLPFALAGLMLVLFLIVCNLTVSMGTVNGLIFYVNIVHVNRAFFFVKPRTSAQVMKNIPTGACSLYSYAEFGSWN